VLPRADFVLLATPLTPETRGMISRERLARLRPGAGIVNMARGAIVDQDALCDALDAGRLSGAVLDVFTPEPLPPDSRVWTTRNLVVSPHVSCDDPATYTSLSLDLLLANLECWAAGRPMPNRIDTARWY
jgi:phosphoglycerate dehydrogenase-like enzyme